MKIIKRNGKKEKFNENKIIDAVEMAFIDIDGELNDNSKRKAKEIANFVKDKNKTLTVEEIQNIVEEKLMASNRKDVARAYVQYRYKRNLVREDKSELMQIIDEKLQAKNIQNQNANVDEMSFGGRMGEAKSEMTKFYALKYIVSDMTRNNHLNNEIYTHDLDSYAVGMHNCLSIPFDDLLKNGFNTRQTDVRPAQSINTAFQLLAVIFQLQSLQQFGGVSATHLDWTMVPYVRKSFYKHFQEGLLYIEEITNFELDNDTSIDDERYKEHAKSYKYAMDKTTKELKQAVEGMYHNLNY